MVIFVLSIGSRDTVRASDRHARRFLDEGAREAAAAPAKLTLSRTDPFAAGCVEKSVKTNRWSKPDT
jgi:hypothetical protein